MKRLVLSRYRFPDLYIQLMSQFVILLLFGGRKRLAEFMKSLLKFRLKRFCLSVYLLS